MNANLPYNMTESSLFRSMLIGTFGGQDVSANQPTPKVADKEEWLESIRKFSAPRSALNAIVMEYLVKEGFKVSTVNCNVCYTHQTFF